MKTYVLGFMFSEDLDKLALIRKARPGWMAGRLNGIGGKVEPGENTLEAMRREFGEETGCQAWVPWSSFGEMRGDGWRVAMFTATGDLTALRSATDEEVEIKRVCYLDRNEECLDNLCVLIPAALHHLRQPDGGRPRVTLDYCLTEYGA